MGLVIPFGAAGVDSGDAGGLRCTDEGALPHAHLLHRRRHGLHGNHRAGGCLHVPHLQGTTLPSRSKLVLLWTSLWLCFPFPARLHVFCLCKPITCSCSLQHHYSGWVWALNVAALCFESRGVPMFPENFPLSGTQYTFFHAPLPPLSGSANINSPSTSKNAIS